ncbi:hypothetical protein [Oceaniglobus indicus]|uniref:hypothetical protein n=1 Tax=Oceaniglobus indicus TaxID=2047749 RepID=UPI000C18BB9F|nr:hypothetical protein [Oceaniglobus indicus]
MNKTFKFAAPLAALTLMSSVALAQTNDDPAGQGSIQSGEGTVIDGTTPLGTDINKDPEGQGSTGETGLAATSETPENDDPVGRSSTEDEESTATGTTAASGNVTTTATANIAGPVGAEDVQAGTVVMSSNGDILGKVVSTVDTTSGTNLIIQVEGTEGDMPEKNVTLPMSDFMNTTDGNFSVNTTTDEFMMLVDDQNPG